jgi:hypothetical protein
MTARIGYFCQSSPEESRRLAYSTRTFRPLDFPARTSRRRLSRSDAHPWLTLGNSPLIAMDTARFSRAHKTSRRLFWSMDFILLLFGFSAVFGWIKRRVRFDWAADCEEKIPASVCSWRVADLWMVAEFTTVWAPSLQPLFCYSSALKEQNLMSLVRESFLLLFLACEYDEINHKSWTCDTKHDMMWIYLNFLTSISENLTI